MSIVLSAESNLHKTNAELLNMIICGNLFLFVIFCEFWQHQNYKNLIYALNSIHNITTYRYMCHIIYNLNMIAIHFIHSFMVLPVFSGTQTLWLKSQFAWYECLLELMNIFIKTLQLWMFKNPCHNIHQTYTWQLACVTAFSC